MPHRGSKCPRPGLEVDDLQTGAILGQSWANRVGVATRTPDQETVPDGAISSSLRPALEGTGLIIFS